MQKKWLEQLLISLQAQRNHLDQYAGQIADFQTHKQQHIADIAELIDKTKAEIKNQQQQLSADFLQSHEKYRASQADIKKIITSQKIKDFFSSQAKAIIDAINQKTEHFQESGFAIVFGAGAYAMMQRTRQTLEKTNNEKSIVTLTSRRLLSAVDVRAFLPGKEDFSKEQYQDLQYFASFAQILAKEIKQEEFLEEKGEIERITQNLPQALQQSKQVQHSELQQTDKKQIFETTTNLKEAIEKLADKQLMEFIRKNKQTIDDNEIEIPTDMSGYRNGGEELLKALANLERKGTKFNTTDLITEEELACMVVQILQPPVKNHSTVTTPLISGNTEDTVKALKSSQSFRDAKFVVVASNPFIYAGNFLLRLYEINCTVLQTQDYTNQHQSASNIAERTTRIPDFLKKTPENEQKQTTSLTTQPTGCPSLLSILPCLPCLRTLFS